MEVGYKHARIYTFSMILIKHGDKIMCNQISITKALFAKF